jgi:hypothetical protein
VAQFYLDHDVSIHVAPELRALGHIAATSRAYGQESAPDPQQLLTATDHEWILVSHNRKDFELLDDAWHVWTTRWGITEPHAGILILLHGSAGRSAQLLHEFSVAHPESIAGKMFGYRPSAGWVQYE